MSKVIEGVPDYISRDDYLNLIASVGFDVECLRSLTFGHDGIHAEVLETNPDGSARIEGDEIVVNKVYIPVRDGE